MSAEYRKDIPGWAHQERETDSAWIQANLALFFPLATMAFSEHGRGAVVVDTTMQKPEQGHPSGYVPQELLAELHDNDIDRLVREYEPENEFVMLLWKTGDKTSAYRVRPLRRPS